MNKFLTEIHEQPAALERTLNYYLKGEGAERLKDINKIWKSGKYRRILFTGMGSSYFAPHTSSALLSSHGIYSSVINAGELLHYHRKAIPGDALFVAISQSGESYEIVKLLELQDPGLKCIGITNEEKSTLAGKSGIALLSMAGREDMTSTKTYISTLMVLHIFSLAIAGSWDERNIAELKEVIIEVDRLVKTSESWIEGVSSHLGHPHFVQVIGRGPSYSSVKQGALMFMEAARNPAAGIYGGEFRHGPMEMVKEGFRAVLFAPGGATFDQALKMAKDITGFGGKVLMITNRREEISDSGILPFEISCENEYLFPVPAIIPLQFIVNRWATEKGNEPGDFTRGAKVTITE